MNGKTPTRTSGQAQPTTSRPVRCAIYTRKSTDEGLEQSFNSLDAQREAGEAYVVSQKELGWICLPNRYDDGGFSGGNMERPALKRLFQDVEAGEIDCVLVHKVDRLSRSLLDFARMMEVFEKHNASFVSVTQQFNSASSMGRLTLNVLLSFAQFEREIISERTRDKISAARRKGKWTGGIPMLGYDVDREKMKLVVNEEEAERVRQIFDLYVEHAGLIPTVKDLNALGWRTKRWVTRKGEQCGGKAFTKGRLRRMLTNVLYTGRVSHHGKIYPGEHQGIVELETWETVNRMLARNCKINGPYARNRYGALLRGILYCGSCNTAMVHTYTVRGPKRYRYYVCFAAQQNGWDSCPTKSVNAQEIEDAVVREIEKIGTDPRVMRGAVDSIREKTTMRLAQLREDQAKYEREKKRVESSIVEAISRGSQDENALEHLRRLQDQKVTFEEFIRRIRGEIADLEAEGIDVGDIRTVMNHFMPVWKNLVPREQVRIFRLLLDRVTLDGTDQSVTVAFRSQGIRRLCQGLRPGTGGGMG